MKFKMLLIKALIAIVAAFILYNTVIKPIHESVQIIEQHQQIKSSEYIISEKMIMDKLQSKSQIVSLEQSFKKSYTDVDDGLFGVRHTKLSAEGSFKLGLDTKSIKIIHIDKSEGNLYIKLGKPVLISLELPYDKIHFDKKQGFFRLSMSEEEQQKFYKSVETDIEHKLMKNKELQKQADLYNQSVVKELLMQMDGVDGIIFE